MNKEALNVTIRDTLPDDPVAWDAMASCTGYADTFVRHGWLNCWWRELAPPRARLYVLEVQHEGEPIAWLPSYWQRTRARGVPWLRVVRFLGGIESTYRDLLCEPAMLESCWLAVLAHLARHRTEWDVLHLTNFQHDSPSNEALPASLEALGLPYQRGEGIRCPFMLLPESLDDWEKSLCRATRRNLRKHENRLRKAFPATSVCEFTDPEQAEHAISTLIELHQGRWRSLGGPGVFGDPRREAFYRQQLHCLAQRGEMVFHQLRVGDQIVACLFSFRQGERLHAFLSGWDPGWADHSVMWVMWRQAVALAIAGGFKFYDLSIGDYAYKGLLASGHLANQDYVVAASRLKMALWNLTERRPTPAQG